MTTTTIKPYINQEFAQRLREALLSKGYCSSRSPSGVHMQKFADMTGYSLQICRKYLRGEAIPELNKLVEIAQQLEVSPGWLLFGDCHSKHPNEKNKITISKELLHYIYFNVSKLQYPEDPTLEQRTHFFVDLTQEVSNIALNSAQSKKIIDLALNSAKHFVIKESLSET
ncbi:MAG TPA: helix-turn-helix transcriptional regulator [Legionellaceae bacterium]|nr:helix-turn-helix transcriptional regulator [Legionellaceae bacterium]